MTQLPQDQTTGFDADTSVDQSSTADVAKQRADDVKESAKDAGAQVAGTAKQQAGEVAGEAKRQARSLLHQSRDEMTQQARQQQHRAATSLRALGDQLGTMSDAADQPGLAKDLTRQAADTASQWAGWLEGREPGDLLDEVRDFARRRPSAFLAVAAGAGLVVGRLARGLKDDASDGSGTSGAHRTGSATGSTTLPPTGTAAGAGGYPAPGTTAGSSQGTGYGAAAGSGYATGYGQVAGEDLAVPEGSDLGGRP